MTSPVLPGVPGGTAHTGAGVHLVLWAALLTAVLPLDVVGVEDSVLLDNQTVQGSQQLFHSNVLTVRVEQRRIKHAVFRILFIGLGIRC